MEHGYRTGSIFVYPHRVEYTCAEGFALRGGRYRECQADGTWSGELPTCERAANAAALQYATSLLSLLLCSCAVRRPARTGSRTHGVGGARNVQHVRNADDLLVRERLQAARFGESTLQARRSVERHATDLSKLVDSSYFSVCLRIERWSPQENLVSVVDCGEPDTLYNGYIHRNQTTYNSTIRFE